MSHTSEMPLGTVNGARDDMGVYIIHMHLKLWKIKPSHCILSLTFIYVLLKVIDFTATDIKKNAFL